jgi:hypothetical protein
MGASSRKANHEKWLLFCTSRILRDFSRLMRPAQYLICASPLVVGPENNHQVCIGQANFDNDCTVITM